MEQREEEECKRITGGESLSWLSNKHPPWSQSSSLPLKYRVQAVKGYLSREPPLIRFHGPAAEQLANRSAHQCTVLDYPSLCAGLSWKLVPLRSYCAAPQALVNPLLHYYYSHFYYQVKYEGQDTIGHVGIEF